MQSKATTVEAYLAQLPPERRAALDVVRQVILRNLPAGYEEGMQCGMIGYYVPHRLYEAGYHCDPRQPVPYVSLASQKQYMSLYLMCLYGDRNYREWFLQQWEKTGKKLDMGKSCLRFRRVDDLPLPLIGRAISRVTVKKLLAFYEAALSESKSRRPKQGR